MQDAAYFGRPDVKDTSGCLEYFKYSLERLIEIEESAERMQAVAENEGYRSVSGTQNDNVSHLEEKRPINSKVSVSNSQQII